MSFDVRFDVIGVDGAVSFLLQPRRARLLEFSEAGGIGFESVEMLVFSRNSSSVVCAGWPDWVFSM